MKPVSVHTLLDRWSWKPLRQCPGRFVLVTTDRTMTVEKILECARPVHTFIRESARDPILVVPLHDGGLLSYARPDGTFVHTLNTSEGFARKLSQLGIVLDSQSEPNPSDSTLV